MSGFYDDEIRDSTDEQLVRMLVGNYGPGRQDAIQSELNRRLIVQLQRSSKRTEIASWVIAALTVVLVALTIVLLFR